ncbi:3-isopropylmalate dehydratase large subunit [Roseomonas alkaliterrae]|uniref:3-isopropylmalate dehydratase n=1 Tax=Neoroseomonas alkaliterrae TaxID=1452450 RepID=A0A840Y2R6_9PROT|nr:3-isopropylmalate dehydratase large subunit [Neoroseomonas alkaliterrae]MBB5690291.1 3-isopropylmalate/(R)-2-methylmalate dehydratase large subunit [Neoroseomonas alkaliterrae]MBR0676175.1 3-isopropylmalate dehydratase large subunit [Neoroseomonas alkaliterrae]
MPATMLDRIWDPHVVADLGGGWSLLHCDRVLLHDLSGGRALEEVLEAGHRIARPDLVFATPDHAVSSAPGRTAETFPKGGRLLAGLRARAAETGIRLFDLGQDGNGIVHVMAPELGIVLPGTVLVCGDSHTCTNGGLGALAFGIGASELRHVLATQTLPQKKPRSMRIRFEGTAPPGVTPKDMILAAIGRFGAGAGTGHAVEYAGSAVRALSVEGRLTLCNLSIEMGAKIGMVAPDETTFEWLAGRDFAPRGAAWDAALRAWRALPSDAEARFDRDLVIEMRDIAPQITWGTSPEHVLPVTGRVPDPAAAANAEQRTAWEAALAYMGLAPGAPIAGTKVDWVFIGSCTNSRIEDLRAAAAVLRGRKVAPHVTAWVVPGSERVKRAAEAEGLDAAFRAAGFEWREPGCALCVAANGEAVPPGARCVSTSNRNFVGRQGTGARTHLASPAMAAAAAVTGAIADVRQLAA